MLRPVYLVVLEGYCNRYFETMHEVNTFLDEVAKERKENDVECVDEWLWDMKNDHFSGLYTHYPEIIVRL